MTVRPLTLGKEKGELAICTASLRAAVCAYPKAVLFPVARPIGKESHLRRIGPENIMLTGKLCRAPCVDAEN